MSGANRNDLTVGFRGICDDGIHHVPFQLEYIAQGEMGFSDNRNFISFELDSLQIDPVCIEKTTTLKFHAWGAQTMPQFLFSFTNLISLELGCEKTTNIPSEIGMLTKLQKLTIFSAAKSLPDTIKQLDCLTQLNLQTPKLCDFSNITTLPRLINLGLKAGALHTNSLPYNLFTKTFDPNSYVKASFSLEMERMRKLLCGIPVCTLPVPSLFAPASNFQYRYECKIDISTKRYLAQLGIMCCAKFRWKHVFRPRFVEIGLGLQTLSLPALVVYFIMLDVYQWKQMACNIPLMHEVWTLITTIKYF